MIFRNVLLLAFTATAFAQTKTVVLDGHSKGRVFDGLGALSAGASSRLLVDYPEPQRSQILDYLFKPGYGATLQHLKVEVGGDMNSTDGSEPSHMRSRNDHDYTRGYEWWLMEEARKRNPRIVLDILPWGAPGWVGNGKLYSADMAEYMADFIEGAKRVHHLDISYVGLWNEKPYDATYVKQLHKALVAHHLDTKLVCCDEYPRKKPSEWEIADAIKTDAELKASIDVIGAHYPRDKDGKLTVTDAARSAGVPLWSSEDQPNSGGGPFVSRDWPVGGRILAHLYNNNYLEGQMTATEIWSPITSYYDLLAAPNSGLMYANTPWSGHYDVQGTIWATAHTTQFTHVGWQYLDSSSGNMPEKGTFVTLRSPDSKDFSTVLETIDAKSPQTLAFTLAGGLKAQTLRVWETNGSKTFEHVGDITVHDGGFTYTFDPDSLYTLTTLTTGGRGVATPPPAASFPMPYADDFEHTPLARAAKYLADQDGAFEAHPCTDRVGRCLRQVITEKPIPWGPIPDPFTLAGDSSATDYSVAADFSVRTGDAKLMGRIDSSDVFSDQKALLPSAYVLTVQSDGEWSLVSAAYKKPTVKLAGGAVTLKGPWHHFVLSMVGDHILAALDGAELASVHDGTHGHGMFGFGSGWHLAEFDNLSVAPAH